MRSEPCGSTSREQPPLANPTPSKRPRVFDVEDDEELSPLQHMLAGAAAGMTEHIFMYPVDTVKTKMQSYVAARDFSGWGVMNAARSIVAKDGARGLWRGVGAVALSAGPAHALYFATYEACKKWGMKGRKDVTPFVAGLSGVFATISLDGIMTPMDVVKQRMQLASRKAYPSVFQSIKSIYQNHGLTAFYAGYKTTLIMNVPFTAMYFAGYESAKSFILDWNEITDEDFSAASHCAAGAIAGTTAASITNPLDVVKTRLQTQGEVGARRYRGMWHALRTIKMEEGWKGLLRGIVPRVLFHAPAAAVCWTTYEFCKHLMDSSPVSTLQQPQPQPQPQSSEIHLSN